MMKFAVFNFDLPKKQTMKWPTKSDGQKVEGQQPVTTVCGSVAWGEKVIFMARGSRVTPSAWATAACPCQSADCPAHVTSSRPTLPVPCQLCSLPGTPGGHLSLSRTGYLWQKCKINDVWREIVAKKCAKLNFGPTKLSIPRRGEDTPRQRRPGRR